MSVSPQAQGRRRRRRRVRGRRRGEGAGRAGLGGVDELVARVLEDMLPHEQRLGAQLELAGRELGEHEGVA